MFLSSGPLSMGVMRPTKITSLACALVFAASLSACGSSTSASTTTTKSATAASAVSTGGGGSGDSSTTTAADTGTKTDEQKALAFAKCMRDEGLDWPDPTVAADGSISFGGTAGGPPAGAQQTGFQAAITKCQPLAEGASFLPKQSDISGIQDSLLKIAKCLRDKGFDVTDPDLSGGPGNISSPLGPNFNPQDPKNSAAIAECQKDLNITLPGQAAGSGS
jgi:hypothetical protein